MQSGFTCHTCRLKITRAIHGRKFLTAASISPPRRKWTSVARPDAQRPPNTQSCTIQQQRRTVVSLRSQKQNIKDAAPELQARGVSSASLYGPDGPLLLRPDNLFHSFSKSPIPEIRRRAAYMKSNAYCPHSSHHQAHLPTASHNSRTNAAEVEASLPPAHVKFECPDCGIPVHCCEEHWADDYENHIEICDTLRQVNEDDHDMRSGRSFPEFEYPQPQIEEILPNMTNWDTYLYTREYNAINDERSLRHATKLLTYPLTIGSVLHELSPYNIRRGGRLTTDGLKSLSALRYMLHPEKTGSGDDIKGLRRSPPPMRIFILGARAESSLPREVWLQLCYIFHRVKFHMIFVGPESMMNRDSEFPLPARTPENPFGAVVEGRISFQIKMSTFVEYYHTLHKARLFQPFDPYFDCFVLFHPGLGHPASTHEWEETLPQLLETKVPVLCTGYTEWDMNRDWEWVQQKVGAEVDLLMEPGENIFRSLKWDLNDLDTSDLSCGNWGVWAFRGKRYETTMKD